MPPPGRAPQRRPQVAVPCLCGRAVVEQDAGGSRVARGAGQVKRGLGARVLVVGRGRVVLEKEAADAERNGNGSQATILES